MLSVSLQEGVGSPVFPGCIQVLRGRANTWPHT